MMGWLHLPRLALLLTVDAGPPVQDPVTPLAAPQLLAPYKNGVRVGAGGNSGSASPPQGTREIDLRPARDGSGDLLFDAPGFSARIASDGSVKFSDKRITLLSLIPWRPLAGPQNVPSLQGTIKGLLRKRGVPARQDDAINEPPRLGQPVITPFRPDPREGCRQCNLLQDSYLPIAVFGFDITDEMMRLSGQEPYRYEKARFLVATRERRVRRAAQTHAQNVRAATNELPGRLQEIACDPRRTTRERRQIIETLRDELDGGTPEARKAADEITRFLSQYFAGGDAVAPTVTCPKSADR